MFNALVRFSFGMCLCQAYVAGEGRGKSNHVLTATQHLLNITKHNIHVVLQLADAHVAPIFVMVINDFGMFPRGQVY